MMADRPSPTLAPLRKSVGARAMLPGLMRKHIEVVLEVEYRADDGRGNAGDARTRSPFQGTSTAVGGTVTWTCVPGARGVE